jgi:hypothetical protein
VRHVRMLGLCLVAIFAMSATMVVIAAPAQAACNQECKEQKAKEKQEAKEKKEHEREEQGKSQWRKFIQCPDNPSFAMSACVYGEAGPESFFQAGKVTVHFVKTVKLSVGLKENEETGTLTTYPALNGQSISKEAEPAPALNEDIDTTLLSTQCGEGVQSACAELARYEAYVAGGGSMKATATIELATTGVGGIQITDSALLAETGAAFVFPVMIHLSNKFVGKTCYVGSTAAPVVVPFTTGTTSPEPPNEPIHGQVGEITEPLENTLELHDPILVNNEYAAPGVHGCGINGHLNGALDSALGLPSPAGSNTTELIGKLYQTGAETAFAHLNN